MSTYNFEQGSVFSTIENCHFAWQLKHGNLKLSEISLNQLLLKNVYTTRLHVPNAANPNTLKGVLKLL